VPPPSIGEGRAQNRPLASMMRFRPHLAVSHWSRREVLQLPSPPIPFHVIVVVLVPRHPGSLASGRPIDQEIIQPSASLNLRPNPPGLLPAAGPGLLGWSGFDTSEEREGRSGATDKGPIRCRPLEVDVAAARVWLFSPVVFERAQGAPLVHLWTSNLSRCLSRYPSDVFF